MTLARKSRCMGNSLRLHDGSITFLRHSRFPAARSARWPLPGRGARQCRVCRVPPMAPPPNSSSSIAAVASGLAALGIWRLLAVAAPHVGAVAVMLRTETDFGSRLGFVLAWGILNFV